jgi:hypothetical protein
MDEIHEPANAERLGLASSATRSLLDDRAQHGVVRAVACAVVPLPEDKDEGSTPQGVSTERRSHGIRTRASTVTSAAAVMVAVFAIFARCARST